MRLFYSQTSPYVRKVLVGLHETGQFEDVELVPTSGVPTQKTHASPNPLGKVPSLERADGPALYDSRTICRYLDARAGGGLYPEGNRLWDTLTVEATADGILDAAIAMVYEARLRPEGARSEEIVEGNWSKVDRALTALNEIWVSHLHGKFDFGQIAVGCALGYLDFRLGDRNWREGRAELAAWDESFSRRASMEATKPPSD